MFVWHFVSTGSFGSMWKYFGYARERTIRFICVGKFVNVSFNPENLKDLMPILAHCMLPVGPILATDISPILFAHGSKIGPIMLGPNFVMDFVHFLLA